MFKPTEEQQTIINSVNARKNILISAFAGTGKTSTLKLITDQYPNKKFLYLAYNKSLEKEAHSKFGGNVKACTVHSLAYKFIGYQYQYKLNLKFYLKNISDYFKTNPVQTKENNHNCFASPNNIAACAKDTVANFCMGDSDEIMPFHLNKRHLEKFQDKYKLVDYSLDNLHKPTNFLERFLLASYMLAQKLWEEMKNTENKTIGMTHDGYLKLYQLSKPIISGYDCIMLDEAQDANAPILDILNNQTCQRIYVGDSNQQIYAWRGSIDAMKKIEGIELYLTKSFRFGEKLAFVANKILKIIGEERILIGNNALDTVIADVNVNHPYTIIFRTNAELFNECLTLAAKDKKIHILGGLKQPLELFESAYYLWKDEPEKVRSTTIRYFYSWARLTEEAELSSDTDLLSTVKFIERYRDNTLDILLKIKDASKYTEDKADVILATGHRAKGREWDQVIIYSDFPHLHKAKGQELNLLYVSATRAMKCLKIMPDFNLENLTEKRCLTIELVPQTCWFSNVRSNISTVDWDKLKKISAKKTGNKCEICSGRGNEWAVECHEIWHYDDKKKIQTLKGLISLCPPCHEVKHMGLANKKQRGHIAEAHLAKVNGWDKNKTSQYVREQFAVWLERSKYQWELDISWLIKLGVPAIAKDRHVNSTISDEDLDFHRPLILNDKPLNHPSDLATHLFLEEQLNLLALNSTNSSGNSIRPSSSFEVVLDKKTEIEIQESQENNIQAKPVYLENSIYEKSDIKNTDKQKQKIPDVQKTQNIQKKKTGFITKMIKKLFLLNNKME